MKKLFALLLSLTLLCGMTVVMAEEKAIEVPVLENGTWVPFEDHGFQICLPSDWVIAELTDELKESGTFFLCQSPDGTHSFSIALSALETTTDMDSVAKELAATYEGAQAITINEIPFVAFNIKEQDINGIAALNTDGTGLYQFMFYPASDADFEMLSTQIVASIQQIQK